MYRIITITFLLLLSSTCLLSQVRWNTTGGHVVQSGGFLVLRDASFYNNGTYVASDGYVVLSGSGADALSVIGGDSITTFYGLEIHKSANNALLEQQAIVAFNLNLTGGLFDIQNDSLRLLSSADITGSSAATYVKTSGGGYLIIPSPADGSAVVFPVGNSAYNPLTLANTGTQDTFGLRVRDEILEQNDSGSPITEEYVNRTWDLFEELVGGSDMDLTLQWNALEELTNFTRADAEVIRFESGAWADRMSNATTGTDPYQVSAENIPEVGSFSVSSAFLCPAFTDCPTYPDPFYVGMNDCTASISFTRPTVDPICTNVTVTASITDSLGAAVVTDVSDPDGDYAPGEYTITWRAVNTDGDEDLCTTETFMVLDTVSPTISSCPVDRVVDLNANCELEIPDLLMGLTASDNCSALLSQFPLATLLVQNLNDGDTQTVTITATDLSGNTNNTPCIVTLTANNTATVSITAAPDASEGDSGTTDFIFTITRTGPSCAFDLDFTTSNGTAIAGSDYVAQNGTLNFAAGEMSKDITVAINGDNIAENDETFSVVISNPTNGVSLGTSSASSTILNDDIVQFSFEQSTYSIIELDDGTRVQEIGVVPTSASDGTLTFTVDYATSDGTATTADNDYVATSGTLTFGPGVSRRVFLVTINGDTQIELDETVNLDLSNPTGAAAIDNGTATLTIENDDFATLTVEDVAMNEGSTGGTTDFIFTVTLDSAVTGGFDLAYTTNDGSATLANNDYGDNDGSLTFAGNAGETQQITVTVNHDNTVESDETFSIILGAVTNNPLASEIDASDGATGTIIDDDATLLSFELPSYSIVELDNGTRIQEVGVVFVTASDPTQTYTVDYSTSDGTATTADSDYLATSGTLTFGPGVSRQVFTVTINGDENVEPDEIINLTLSNPTGPASVSNGSATLTIDNDDEAVLTVVDVTLAEGTGAGTTDFTFTVTLDSAITGGFDVAYNTIDGSAIVTDGDYTAASGTLSFAGTAGETQQFTVAVNEDAILEADETFGVELGPASNLNNGFLVNTDDGAIGTITNDDAANFSINDVDIKEGDGAAVDLIFDVTLDAEVQGGASIDFTTLEGSATLGDNDFTTNSGTLNFGGTAGETQTVTINIIGDTQVEADEDLRVQLSNPTNMVGISDTFGLGTIINDDTTSFRISDAMILEGDAGTQMLEVEVLVDEIASTPVSVSYTTTDGTATLADNDYQSTSGTLNFSAGQSRATFLVTINGDTQVELDEIFMITLSNPTGPAILADEVASITITSDDQATLAIDGTTSISELEGDAGNTAVNIPITITNGPVDAPITVNYVLNDGTATTADNDYSDAGSGSIIIPAGATSGDIIVNIIGDTNNEDNEQFTVTITSIDATGRDVVLGNTMVPVTIIDDDFICPTVGDLVSNVAVCIGESRPLTASGLATMAESDNNEIDFGIRFVYFSSPTTDPYSGGTDLGTVAFLDLDNGGTAATIDAVFPNTPGSVTIYAILSPTPADVTCRPFQSVTVEVLGCGITNDDDNFPGIEDPCVCKNNATTLTNGQFDELVEVVDAPAGETWTVTQINGLFASASSAPPVAPIPIPIGTVLTEQPTGTTGVSNYVLTGIHVDDIGYSIMVSNGITTLGISNRCWYPNPSFSNLAAAYCRTNPNVTLMGTAQLGGGTGEATPEMETFIVINVANNTTVVNDVEGNAILDIANLPAGRYRVIYTFDAADDDPSFNHPGCSQSIEQEFEIIEVECGTFPWGGGE
ncbi:MAG: Calx-beta domain-containing protein [Bacteroidota bacterium]